MKRAHLLLLPCLLAACTSVDPWRHFPRESRPSPVFSPGQESAPSAAAPQPGPQCPAAPVAQGRRAVPARIVGMPPAPGPPPAVPSPVLPPAPAVSGPQPIIGCDGLACATPEGRVQGGTGNVHLDPGGRPCHAAGGWLQCF